VTAATLPARLEELPANWRSKIDVADDGCWMWTGSKGWQGYGQAWLPETKSKRLSHLAVYELLVGPIPEGHDLGHRCHDRDLACPGGICRHHLCCNPEHLEPQTRTENNLSGRLGAVTRANHAKITHCPQNHPYDETNTYQRKDRPAGGRQCRECTRERNRQRRARLAEARR
jgi:hypothetical protein